MLNISQLSYHIISKTEEPQESKIVFGSYKGNKWSKLRLTYCKGKFGCSYHESFFRFI